MKTGRFCFLLLLVLMLCCLASAQAESAVGTEIGPEDITDFYYTVDASVYPPFYQRYRFWQEDGKKWFFHETRQGEEWPLTEEHTVFSGTLEVSPETWSAFFSCLEGGTVRERSEEVLDGDSGPWTYLYWKGDEGKYQEFSFPSYGGRLAFEKLCSDLAQNHILTHFSLTRGGYLAPQTLEMVLRDSGHVLLENDGESHPVDPAFAEALQQIMDDCRMESWDGFRGHNPNVLDGEDFSLRMTFADGTSVFATGSNQFPEGYAEACSRIDKLFEKEQMARTAGTYRYAGPSDQRAEITLHADGTCSITEGTAGLDPAGGTWSVFDHAVYVNTDGEPALEFMFAMENDALIYLAMGSDPFPAIPVSDGGQFLRVMKGEETMRLQIGETEVPVTWEDNASVDALRGLLPLTIGMHMYGGFEQVGPIGQELPSDDHQTTTGAGDIVLYAGDQIVIFYGSNAWAYTRLGHVNLPAEEMADLLSHGDVTLTLR